MKLSPKQKAFCDYYIECANATEAALKAGYSEKTAKEMGYENLTKPHIKAYIDERIQGIESDRIAGAEEVLQYLTKGMRGELTEENLTPQGVKVKIGYGSAARNKCAELLGKRYMLFTERVQADINQVVVFEDEQLLED